MIQIYAKENCSRCNVAKTILGNMKLNFEYIENKNELMSISKESKIKSAPIIKYNGSAYSLDSFLEVI